jgi:hypothetical protein
MSNLTTAWMLGCVCGFFLGVTAQGWRRRSTCRELMSKPYSSAAIAWRDAETQRDANDTARAKHAAELYAKFIDPSLGVPWEEGRTQRGNGSGGPTTPKPPIKPQLPDRIVPLEREPGNDSAPDCPIWAPLGWAPPHP